MKQRFDINLLNKFSFENDVEIIGEYNKINRQTIITGKCITFDCNEYFSKAFRTLFDNKSFYCDKCMMKIKVENIQNTTLKNHGNIYALRCSKIIDKMKKTNISKYGCEFSLQNIEVKKKDISLLLKNMEVILHIVKKLWKKCLKMHTS